MATRQEIIDTIDAFLEGRITLKEAMEWAQIESTRTPLCEDPPSVLLTFIGSALFGDDMGRSLKEQLLMDKEVLVHGIPCPHEELGKTVDAYWLAFTPWEKIVLCQVKITESGERILEVAEEAWDGTKLFHEEISIPLKEGNGSPVTWEDIEKKERELTQEEFLQWIVNQLQNENTLSAYQNLLLMYWRTRRRGYSFAPEYIKGQNKAGYIPEALLKLVECIHEREEAKKKEEDLED